MGVVGVVGAADRLSARGCRFDIGERIAVIVKLRARILPDSWQGRSLANRRGVQRRKISFLHTDKQNRPGRID